MLSDAMTNASTRTGLISNAILAQRRFCLRCCAFCRAKTAADGGYPQFNDAIATESCCVKQRGHLLNEASSGMDSSKQHTQRPANSTSTTKRLIGKQHRYTV